MQLLGRAERAITEAIFALQTTQEVEWLSAAADAYRLEIFEAINEVRRLAIHIDEAQAATRFAQLTIAPEAA